MTGKAKQPQRARHPAPPRQASGVWQRGKWWFLGGGAAGALALLIVLTFLFAGPEPTGGEAPVTSSQSQSTPVPFPSSQGAPTTLATSLPNFSLALYQGQNIVGSEQPRFHDLLGKKPIVLNYWASECPPCYAEMPGFEKVWRNYKDKVLFVGLDMGRFAGLGGPQASRVQLQELRITYPAAPAPDIETISRLGLQALLSTDFITPDGKVYKKWVGTLSETKLTELVEGLLNAS